MFEHAEEREQAGGHMNKQISAQNKQITRSKLRMLFITQVWCLFFSLSTSCTRVVFILQTYGHAQKRPVN